MIVFIECIHASPWNSCSVEYREKIMSWDLKSNQWFGTKRKSFSIRTSWFNSLPSDTRTTQLCFESKFCCGYMYLASCVHVLLWKDYMYCVWVPQSVSVYLNEVCLQCNAELTIISYLCGEKEVPFTVGRSFVHSENGANFASKGL